MKFTIIALAGALASANAHQLRTVRKLEGAQRAEFDGSAIISFAKCIEVTVQSEDADEDTQSAVLAGTAKPVKSFAAFYTNTYVNDNEMMMTGLGDYVAAKVKSSAMKAQNTCETCRQFEETCNPEEEEVEEEAAENEYADEAEGEDADADADEAEDGNEADAEDGEDAERKLATAIDSSFCYECQSLGCYVEEEDNGNAQVDYAEQLAQFIENAAGCMEVQNYADANGNAAYIGMACGSYGDAAEFAVFLDGECTIETNKVSAASVLASAGANEDGVSMSQVMSYASMYMQEAFTTSLSCEQVGYYDPNNADEDGNQNYADEDAAVEMNEACGNIINEAVYIADCAAEDAAEEDEADEDEDKWYDFDVQDGGDLYEVCAVVNYKMNMGEDFTYFYDETKQGTSYDRDMGGHLKSSSNGSGMSGGMIFLIVALVAGIVVAPVAWLINSKKNTQASETDYQGGTLS
mmetsp:Transcript_15800/g.23844  ORF Transcript_15800/g.23844 Transcript_15800/m.23844 type:complete len:465 (-) Transcript_15800:166-1560(-)